MSASSATVTAPQPSDDKALARRFQDLLIDMIDPLLADGHLSEGRAARPSVEVLIELSRDESLDGHLWGDQHPLRPSHEGLRIWQATSFACARAIGGEFADTRKWSPDVDAYIFVGNDRLAILGLGARCKDLRQRLTF
jgi:hypothetical protein